MQHHLLMTAYVCTSASLVTGVRVAANLAKTASYLCHVNLDADDCLRTMP